jgi:DNA-binding response OmpR family regulator
MTKSAAATRLLLVHPDEETRTFLRRRFSRLGYAVIEAPEHERALLRVGDMSFDLVLLDLATPGPDGADGFDLLRRMRERRSLEELPILAIADPAATEDAAEALASGADDCLFRPIHVDLAHARAEMLIGPRGDAGAAPGDGHGELQAQLETLEEATERTEAVSANLVALGIDGIAPINGLLGATAVLIQICRNAALVRTIDRIEVAASALDLVMVHALGRADRRTRAPKDRLRVLVADRDAAGQLSMHQLLGSAQVEVDLVAAAGGSEAVLATDTGFFDLIVMGLAGPEEIAGIQAIRRAERQNKVRRTPILAVGADAATAAGALHAGADLYMRPPVTPERLLAALANALARQSEEVSAVA